VISIERGYDPRDLRCRVWRRGPLHACALAHALRIPRVLIPALPGALSAVGILLADAVRDYSRTVMLPSDANLEAFSGLEERGAAEFWLRSWMDRRCDRWICAIEAGYELNVPFGEEMLTPFMSCIASDMDCQ